MTEVDTDERRARARTFCAEEGWSEVEIEGCRELHGRAVYACRGIKAGAAIEAEIEVP